MSINSLGSIAITEWQGWVVGEFAVNDNNQNIVIQCFNVHTIYLDDNLLPINADVYTRKQFKFSVSLDKGIHTIYVRLRTKRNTFVCSIDIASTSYEILPPHFLPDLWDGYLFSNKIAVPILNNHITKWIKISKVSVSNQSGGEPLTIEKFPEEISIAPGQVFPVNIELQTENKVDLQERIIDSCEGDNAISFQLKFNTNEGQQTYPVKLRCRKRHESFVFTFRDHDGSIQHGAAIEPIEECKVIK